MARIGPKMQEAVDFVKENPGCAILPVAQHIGPNGSVQYGYRAVHRAIEAGLIQAKPGKRKGTYSLTVASEKNAA